MPDPNDPTAGQIPPEAPEADQAMEAALISEGPELSEEEREAGERSSIQNAMEDALDSSFAARHSGAGLTLDFKTYPISEKMRRRLTNEFVYHSPRQDQIPRYAALRSMALTFATMVVELTPPSREQSLALTKIGETVMHANAAIARGEDISEATIVLPGSLTAEKTTEMPLPQGEYAPIEAADVGGQIPQDTAEPTEAEAADLKTDPELP